MNETKRNYKIYDQELLAIMEGLKQWRQYLIGSDQFEIWTDHKNLGYFKKPQKLNRCQAQWMTELQEYNFQLVHKPCNSQKKVDVLSRRLDHSQGKDNNEDQTVLKEEWFRNLTIQKGEFWKEIKEVDKRGSIRSNGKIRRRLETRREGNTIEGENLYSRFSYTPRRNCHQVSQFQTSGTSRLYQDTQTNHEKLLVASNIRRHKTICCGM